MASSKSESTEYHLERFPGPDLLNKWPNGCWVVLRASAQELTDYRRFNHGGAYPPPGYLGTKATLAEAAALIEEAEHAGR